jgi:hypothetical protein
MAIPTYPAIDSDTLAAYELDENLTGFSGEVGISAVGGDLSAGNNSHSPPHYGGYIGFVNAVSGLADGFLYDTSPNTASHYGIGLPGLFDTPRCVGFFEGTASADRDYIVLPGGPTSQLATMSLWVQPFAGLGAGQELCGKEYRDNTPQDGAAHGTWAAPFYGAMQFYITSANDGSWGVTINIGGTATSTTITGNTTERVRLRYNQWNHIGATYDGTNLRIYCNGMLAATVNLPGSIDYGAGAWYMGALRNGGGAIAQCSALMKRVRWEKVVKPLSYFFDCYTSVGGRGPGTPPVIS